MGAPAPAILSGWMLVTRLSGRRELYICMGWSLQD